MSKEKIFEQVRPVLDNYVLSLVKELEKRKIIIESKNEKGHYHVNRKNTKISAPINGNQQSIVTQLFELRNVAKNVCLNLYQDSFSQPITFSKILNKLEENNAISIPWKDKKKAHEMLDGLDQLVTDSQIQSSVEKTIVENGINDGKLIVSLLEFFGKQKAIQFFYNISFRETRSDRETDLLLTRDGTSYSPLLFEFKVRKGNVLPDKKLLLRSLRQLKSYATVGNPKPFAFLIIFTNEHSDFFEKVKFQFTDTFESIQEFADFRNQFKFVPVSINGLHLIDNAFEEFKNKYIRQLYPFHLEAKKPPINFPARNDDFMDATFEIKNISFNITVKPTNTKFWRFGFRLAKHDAFPPLTERRHESTEFVDIHLSVGDLIDGENRIWDFSNQLSLTEYRANVLENHLESSHNYNGEPVSLTVTSNHDSSMVKFEVAILKPGTKINLGYRLFDLHEFNFCRIFAWSDYNQYMLDVEMEMERT